MRYYIGLSVKTGSSQDYGLEMNTFSQKVYRSMSSIWLVKETVIQNCDSKISFWCRIWDNLTDTDANDDNNGKLPECRKFRYFRYALEATTALHLRKHYPQFLFHFCISVGYRCELRSEEYRCDCWWTRGISPRHSGTSATLIGYERDRASITALAVWKKASILGLAKIEIC